MKTMLGLSLLSLAFVAGCSKAPPAPTATAPGSPPQAAESLDEPAAIATQADVAEQADASEAATSTAKEEPNDANLGTVKVRFEYGGEPVASAPIKVAGADFCGKQKLHNEKLLVHATNKGIKNVVVYVYTGRGGSELPPSPPRKATVTLANENCRFEPHFVLAQVGDTLKVTNPDPVGHNSNLQFFNNKPENPLIPPGQEFLAELKFDEPAPIPVDCNIHPWMKAYLVVLSHPFAAFSDENGDLTIPGLPVGEKLVFRAFHEAGSIKNVVIDGKDVQWARSRFEVEVKPGVNDLGTVQIPAEALSAN